MVISLSRRSENYCLSQDDVWQEALANPLPRARETAAVLTVPMRGGNRGSNLDIFQQCPPLDIVLIFFRALQSFFVFLNSFFF